MYKALGPPFKGIHLDTWEHVICTDHFAQQSSQPTSVCPAENPSAKSNQKTLKLVHMVVSINGGTTKWMVYKGKSY